MRGHVPTLSRRGRGNYWDIHIHGGTVDRSDPPPGYKSIPINYDESKVRNYILPDPLLLLNGERVTDAETWYKFRRTRIAEPLLRTFTDAHRNTRFRK